VNVTDPLHDLFSAVEAKNDCNIGDTGPLEVLKRVNEHWLVATGMSCLGPLWVSGRSLVPLPPESNNPFIAIRPAEGEPLAHVRKAHL